MRTLEESFANPRPGTYSCKDSHRNLRLHSLVNSQRSIAREVQSSRDTVADMVNAAETADISWPLDDDITNEDIRAVLFPGKYVFLTSFPFPSITQSRGTYLTPYNL